MIVLISDLDMQGSGYMNIAIGLAKQLSERDRKVTILGFGYKGDEHNWPFQLLPVPTHEAWNMTPGMMQNLLVLGATNQIEPPEAIIVALDIPHHMRGLQIPRAVEGRARIPYVGIFPVESGPLSNSWASIIQPMDSALVISKYGLKMMQDAKLTNGTYLPVGMDAEAWRSVTVDERKELRRSLGLTDDDFVVLTVADNQERKNLSAAARGISIAKSKGVPVKWLLVTRVNSQVGWNIPDLANKYGLADSIQPFERGLPHSKLWILHAVSDAFLLTSKAEGLAQLPGSTVWTTAGATPIQDVRVGDEVWSHRGKAKVSKATRVDYAGDVCLIEPSLGLEPLRLTPEHPLLLARKQGGGFSLLGWTPADEVQAGDYIAWPTISEGQVPELRLSEHVEVLVEEGAVCLAGKNRVDGPTFPHSRSARHEDPVEVDEDLMEILGFYAAEGCAAPSGPLFCFDDREVDLHQRVASAMLRKFGVTAKASVRERHRLTMTYNDRLVGRFLSSLCGGRQSERHLPDWALDLPAPLAWRLLECMWLGDGSVSTRNQLVARYSTVSGSLAQQVQFLLLRLGVGAALKTGDHKRGDYEVAIYRPDWPLVPFLRDLYRPASKKEITKTKAVPGYRLIRIRSVGRVAYSGMVHHLEVAGDESYLSGAGILHNCMPILEAMSVGTPVAATYCTAIMEHLFEDLEKKKGQRGFPIEVEYVHVDPWGNSDRSYASPESIGKTLLFLHREMKGGQYSKRVCEITERAKAYARSRTWQEAGDVLDNELRRAISRVRASTSSASVTGVIQPPTVPQQVPMLVRPEMLGGKHEQAE
jgi:glycosyltransferase involved in cell wall biosynthesis